MTERIKQCRRLTFTQRLKSVLVDTMVRAEVRNKGDKKSIQKPIKKQLKKPRKKSSENKPIVITRSISAKLEKKSEPIKDSLPKSTPNNTRSEFNANIESLQTISPRKTRSKSEKIPKITSDSRTNSQIHSNKTKIQSKNSSISTIRFVKLNNFAVDSIVLAKQKYSFPWPAKILNIEKERVFVYFFGDKRSGYISKFEIYDFILSTNAIKASIASKKKPHAYLTGISEVELLME